ncbi:type II toxin-antitoxin system VapC family toxin [Candidatus Woesearchaeota archaeon]|nr:type II toxin-antitoxin system VapC family toxin [Candidatus Woesearchaeota archaeon]
MNYLLDTSVLIDLKKGKGAIKESIRKFINLSQSVPSITFFTFSEYYFGSIKEEKQAEAIDFLNQFQQITITMPAAKLFAELAYKYKAKGIVFDTIDLLNAAIAIEENMIFITSDKFFEKIDELKKIIINR